MNDKTAELLALAAERQRVQHNIDTVVTQLREGLKQDETSGDPLLDWALSQDSLSDVAGAYNALRHANAYLHSNPGSVYLLRTHLDALASGINAMERVGSGENPYNKLFINEYGRLNPGGISISDKSKKLGSWMGVVNRERIVRSLRIHPRGKVVYFESYLERGMHGDEEVEFARLVNDLCDVDPEVPCEVKFRDDTLSIKNVSGPVGVKCIELILGEKAVKKIEELTHNRLENAHNSGAEQVCKLLNVR